MGSRQRILKASFFGSLLATTILTILVFVVANAGSSSEGLSFIPNASGFAWIAFVGGLAVGTPVSILCLSAAILIAGGKLPLGESGLEGFLIGGAAGAIILLLVSLAFGSEWLVGCSVVGALYGGCVGLCWALRTQELEING